jgi:hypothetical protein
MFSAMRLGHVIEVEPLGDFRLRIKFDDGRAGDHDFADLMKEPGSMLDPLRDPTYFARVYLDYGALTWPNGYDMCPDWLRMVASYAGEHFAEAHNSEQAFSGARGIPEVFSSPKNLAKEMNRGRDMLIEKGKLSHERAETAWVWQTRWRYIARICIGVSAIAFLIGVGWPLAYVTMGGSLTR